MSTFSVVSRSHSTFHQPFQNSMPQSSKHIQYKPWRKGKAAEQKSGSGSKGVKKMSLKNQLRGQRRLLAKITSYRQDNGDAKDGGGNEEVLEGVKMRIAHLEKEVANQEAREREKKNSAK
jgi:hypothetical protein